MVDILTHLHQYVPVKEYTKHVLIPSINEVVTLYFHSLREYPGIPA